jgi:energy-converting hydrogenase Eha subunit E
MLVKIPTSEKRHETSPNIGFPLIFYAYIKTLFLLMFTFKNILTLFIVTVNRKH